MTREEWKKVIKTAYDEAHKDSVYSSFNDAAYICQKLLGYIYRAL